MFVLPLLSGEGVPPFPDTEFGCASYLVRDPTSWLLHPPARKTKSKSSFYERIFAALLLFLVFQILTQMQTLLRGGATIHIKRDMNEMHA